MKIAALAIILALSTLGYGKEKTEERQQRIEHANRVQKQVLEKQVDGTPQSVQAAIDSASPGSSLTIASGTYNWTSGVRINKYVKVIGTGVNIVSKTDATMFSVTPNPSGNVELSGITFTGATGLQAYLLVSEASGKPVIVHDCSFNVAGFGRGSIVWQANGGLIYDCDFTSTDKADNSAIQFKFDQRETSWLEKSFLGMDDSNGEHNTYVEDCQFHYHYLQCMDFDGNARVVIRHNVFDNSAITSHGADTGPYGGRQWEIYDNEFIFTNSSNNNPPPGQFPLPMDYFIFIRCGGPGILANNKLPYMSSTAWGNKAELKFSLYNIRRRSQFVSCQTQHPAVKQIGWGINSSGAFVLDPIYIWGNSGGGNYDNPGLNDYDDECGNNQHTADYVKRNREFYTDTQKPGYTPYEYPHPLRSGQGPKPTPTPNPTPGPSPTPSPSATPSPSPTATPPVGDTYRDWLDRLGAWIEQNPAKPDKP